MTASTRSTRARAPECTVVHRSRFNGHALRFVGFGLSISFEGPRTGFGLMSNLPIPPSTPITQYEGTLIPKSHADSVRKGKDGKRLGSHFATTSARQMIINGFSLKPVNHDGAYGGTCLTESEWHGRGGGSLCNHDSEPNAELIRDPSGDGYGLFVVSLRAIAAGEFINVDYGKMFIQSSKSNI